MINNFQNDRCVRRIVRWRSFKNGAATGTRSNSCFVTQWHHQRTVHEEPPSAAGRKIVSTARTCIDQFQPRKKRLWCFLVFMFLNICSDEHPRISTPIRLINYRDWWRMLSFSKYAWASALIKSKHFLFVNDEDSNRTHELKKLMNEFVVWKNELPVEKLKCETSACTTQR